MLHTASSAAASGIRGNPSSPTAQALGHPVRLQILHLLAQADDALCVGDIAACFDLKQPTISHHLRWLKEAGLLTAEVRGTYTYYRLQSEALNGLLVWLQQFAA